MNSLQNLADRPLNEQIDFINSFDLVLSDLDGVLWTNHKTIHGAPECINNLSKRGKSIKFITNNSMNNADYVIEQLRKINIQADAADVSNPLIGAIAYLRKINFDKTLYVLATESYKNEIRKAGFKVAPDMPQVIEESLSKLTTLIQDDERVGAVVVDLDVNLTYVKLQRALTFLKRRDCLFIVGGGDKSLSMGSIGPIIGFHYFQELLRDISGREFYRMAKPSLPYAEYINEIFNIRNPDRVLFIGDSISQDMGFAAVGGYQKLLTLSGNTKMDDITNWKEPEEYKPNYYVDSLQSLNKILQNID